jgi:hypothetical protein
MFGGYIMNRVFKTFTADGTQRDLVAIQDAVFFILNAGSGGYMNTPQRRASGKISVTNYGDIFMEKTI